MWRRLERRGRGKLLAIWLILPVFGCSQAPPPVRGGAEAVKSQEIVEEGQSVETNAVPESVSVFEAEPEAGIDPFFPSSERRAPAVQEDGESPAEVKRAETISGLRIGLISLGRTPRAKINNRIFAEGEGGLVSLEGGREVYVECVEVRAGSVVVLVEGVAGVHEIFL